jgi:hypothetical protein
VVEVSWLRRLARKRVEPLYVADIAEEPAPAGATCESPTPEAFERAITAAKPGEGISEDGMERCGAPATVLRVATFSNAPPQHRLYCDEHRPRRLTSDAASESSPALPQDPPYVRPIR